MLLRLKAHIRLAAAKEWAMKLQIQWINTYEEFKQWVQENDRFPYTKSLDETERKLGSWLSLLVSWKRQPLGLFLWTRFPTPGVTP